ncbi:hypothetical protein JCM10450v2_004860 [Rhodotorula kratochvilovae]
MVSSTHSDSDSDDAASTLNEHTSAFNPVARPSAVQTLLSPPKLRSRRLAPHTPARKHEYATPWAPARPEAPAQSAGESGERLHVPSVASAERGNLNRLYVNKVHPSRVLHRQLNDLYAVVATGKPAINRAAVNEKIHERKLQVVPWSELRSLDDPERFLEVLFETYEGFVEHMDRLNVKDNNPFDDSQRRGEQAKEHLLSDIRNFPQTERFLTNEANASEAFLSNALNGVVAIVEQFLPEEYRPSVGDRRGPVGPGLKIICSGQHPLPGTVDASGKPSALDLTFALVSWPPNAEPKLRFDLVICELKRPGYIEHEHWTGRKNFHQDKVHEYPAALLPQVMLYNKRSECERYILTDYLKTVAVHIEHESMADPQAHVVVGAQPVTFERGRPKSPYEGGEAVAVAFEVAMALRGLGCANEKLFPNAYHDHEGKVHRIPLHPEIKDFLIKNGKQWQQSRD